MSSRQQFLLPNVTPGTRVRLDTASGSTSAADVVDNLNQPISGSIITADSSGRLASGDVYGPAGVTTLYMKTLDGSGNVTATTTLGSSHPSTTGGADPRVDTLLSGAPGALDTLKELADALNDDASFAATMTTLLAGKENVVVHGSTAGTARPAAATIVHWIGSVAPTNGVTNDEWTDTTVPVKKRYSGSAWVSLSGASSAVWPAPFLRVDSEDGGSTFSQVRAYDADGNSTLIAAAGDDTGIPWVKYGSDGQLYVVSAARYAVQLSVAPTTADDSVACNTNGGVGTVVVAAVSASIGGSGSGELFGTPAGAESGGPATEPGWDLLYVYTNSGSPTSLTARIWALDLPDPIPS